MTTMNDDQLAEFLGIKGKKGCAEIMAQLTPDKRALYQRMSDLEIEIKLWQEGVGPKPTGVILCGPKQIRGAR